MSSVPRGVIELTPVLQVWSVNPLVCGAEIFHLLHQAASKVPNPLPSSLHPCRTCPSQANALAPSAGIE